MGKGESGLKNVDQKKRGKVRVKGKRLTNTKK